MYSRGLTVARKSKPKPDTLMTCSGCRVASACSNEHMQFLHKDGHKRYCSLPPFRVPFAEEDNDLCKIILGTDEIFSDATSAGEHLGHQDVENDDDGSWESVDSNDQESVNGKSDVIFAFFTNKSYKFQQRRVQFPIWS